MLKWRQAAAATSALPLAQAVPCAGRQCLSLLQSCCGHGGADTHHVAPATVALACPTSVLGTSRQYSLQQAMVPAYPSMRQLWLAELGRVDKDVLAALLHVCAAHPVPGRSPLSWLPQPHTIAAQNSLQTQRPDTFMAVSGLTAGVSLNSKRPTGISNGALTGLGQCPHILAAHVP